MCRRARPPGAALPRGRPRAVFAVVALAGIVVLGVWLWPPTSAGPTPSAVKAGRDVAAAHRRRRRPAIRVDRAPIPSPRTATAPPAVPTGRSRRPRQSSRCRRQTPPPVPWRSRPAPAGRPPTEATAPESRGPASRTIDTSARERCRHQRRSDLPGREPRRGTADACGPGCPTAFASCGLTARPASRRWSCWWIGPAASRTCGYPACRLVPTRHATATCWQPGAAGSSTRRGGTAWRFVARCWWQLPGEGVDAATAPTLPGDARRAGQICRAVATGDRRRAKAMV